MLPIYGLNIISVGLWENVDVGECVYVYTCVGVHVGMDVCSCCGMYDVI